MCSAYYLGVIHKLRLQDEVDKWLSKCQQMSVVYKGFQKWSRLRVLYQTSVEKFTERDIALSF